MAAKEKKATKPRKKRVRPEPRVIRAMTWDEVAADLKRKYGDRPITIVPLFDRE